MIKEINCTFTMSGTYSLESASVYDAWLEAQGNLPLPAQGEYVEDSMEVESLERCMVMNGWEEEEVEDLSLLSKADLILEIDRRCKCGVETVDGEAYTTTRLNEFLLDYYGTPYAPPKSHQPQPEHPDRNVYAVLRSWNKAMDIKVFESMGDAKEHVKSDLQAEKESLSKKGIEADILTSDELLFTQLMDPDSSHYVYWKIVQTGLVPQATPGIPSSAPQSAINETKDMSSDTDRDDDSSVLQDLRVETPMGAIMAKPELLDHEVWIDLRRPDTCDDLPLVLVSPSVDESGACDGRIKVEVIGEGRKDRDNKVIYFDGIEEYFKQTDRISCKPDSSGLQVPTSLGHIIAKPLASGIWVGLQRSDSSQRLPLAYVSYSAKNGRQTISVYIDCEGRTGHKDEVFTFDTIEGYFQMDDDAVHNISMATAANKMQAAPKQPGSAASFIFDCHGVDDGPLNNRTGETVEVLRQLTEIEVDEEAGPMFHIRFKDGFEANAFANELTLSEWHLS